MKTVKIYIETSFRTPISKRGEYAAALVFTKGGQDFTRTVSGEECETTYNRCVLLAMIRAMQRLNQPCHLEIYTHNTYVKNMIEQGNPEKWRDRNGNGQQAGKCRTGALEAVSRRGGKA